MGESTSNPWFDLGLTAVTDVTVSSPVMVRKHDREEGSTALRCLGLDPSGTAKQVFWKETKLQGQRALKAKRC